MATRKAQINSRISELESLNAANNAEIEALKKELTETAPELLERDAEAEISARAAKMNDFLQKCGLLPSER